MKELMNIFKNEDGVVNIEYALIAALVGIALVALLILLAGGIGNVYNAVVTTLGNAIS